MASYAGPAPWHAHEAAKGNLGIKRQFTEGGMQWTLSSGWHLKRERKSGKTFKMGKIRDYHGKEKRVRMYDDYIGFHANDNPNDPEYNERLAYAEKAFNSAPKDNVKKADGCGHIAQLEYALKEQILRVTFTNNGSVALFFRVPAAVAGSLINMAKTKQTRGTYNDGRPKHLLGIMFWDYIRIRGSQHGAKYPWEYEKKSEGKIVNSRNRHVMKLTAKRVLAILEDDNPVSKRLKAAGASLKPDDEVTVVLNDEEYDKLGKEVNSWLVEMNRLDEARSDKGNKKQKTGKDDDEKNNQFDDALDKVYNTGANQYTGIEDNIARDQILAAVAKFKKSGKPLPAGLQKEYQELLEEEKAREQRAAAKTLYENTAPSKLGEFVERAELELKRAIETFRNDPAHKGNISNEATLIERSWRKQGKEINPAAVEDKAVYNLIKELKPEGIDKVIRLRGTDWAKGMPEQLHIVGKHDFETSKAIIRAAFGESALRSWVDSNLPARYAMHFIGRFWTPQELIDFANPSLPNSISLKDAPDYKKFINARDWQGALNLLKTRTTDLIYEDKYGHKKTLRHEHYASQYDKVAEEN